MDQDGSNLQHSPATAAPEEPAKLGPFQRLTGTIFSPGETFEDVNRKPTWLISMVLAIIFASTSLAFFEWRVKPDWEQALRRTFREQTERTGQTLNEEQLKPRVEMSAWIYRRLAVAPIVTVPFFSLLFSGIFALGLLLIQARATFKKILSVVTWTLAGVGLVQTIVFVATLLVRDTEGINPLKQESFVATNLAALLPAATGPVLKALAAELDVFSIWRLIVLSIGFAAIGGKKVTSGKTGTLVFGIFAIWIVIRVAWAAITGS